MSEDPEVQKEVSERNPRLFKDGSENLDPTPIAAAIGYKRRPSIAEQIREMVRSERIRQELENAGVETFAEADDFEIEDDDPQSPYEQQFEPTPIDELVAREKAAQEELAKIQAAKEAALKAGEPTPDPTST